MIGLGPLEALVVDIVTFHDVAYNFAWSQQVVPDPESVCVAKVI